MAHAPPPLPRLDSSLEWVTLLTPEALDAFLVEKLEARRALVELDLEPSGLVIKHDDDGEVERVEPAVVAEKVRAGRRLLLFRRRLSSSPGFARADEQTFAFFSGVFSGFGPRVNSRRALAHPFGPRERVVCFRPTFSGVCALFFGAFLRTYDATIIIQCVFSVRAMRRASRDHPQEWV